MTSAAVTIGLMHRLTILCPGAGYFRPVERTSRGGNRSLLIHQVYNLQGGAVEDMYGCTQTEALKMIADNRIDDLVDTVVRGFERYRARHDFVLLEGTSLRDGQNTDALNGTFAAALGSPALMVGDVHAAAAVAVHAGKVRAGRMVAVDAKKEKKRMLLSLLFLLTST